MRSRIPCRQVCGLNIHRLGQKCSLSWTVSTRCAVLSLSILSVLLLMGFQSAHAQTQTVLYDFPGGTSGDGPQSRLTPDASGDLYGTTYSGGLGYGTVFKLSPKGSGYTESVLYSFCSQSNCADGATPLASFVTFDASGNLYGTTWDGGASGCGTVFELKRSGAKWKESVLYSFTNGTDGCNPRNGLIWDKAGNLYGTTGYNGGGCYGGCVYELSPSGSGDWIEKTIYTSPGSCDSTCINFTTLVMDASENIYGFSGIYVFELSKTSGVWSENNIYTLPGGTWYVQGPNIDSSGNLYGFTNTGGTKGNGIVWKLSPVTTGKKKGTWTEKALYTFPCEKNPCTPFGDLVLDSSGNIYATTFGGGKYGDGTVFELVAPTTGTAYKEKTLWSFNGTNGSEPLGGLILDGTGNLLGTTFEGGSDGDGTVFELKP
jgi:uncharacterized repeat protein (TIGR03803 family)